MKTRDACILIIPGLGGSGPEHWQTRWESKLSTARRVEQADWDHPDLAAWSGRITKSITEAEQPVILIAHSLGVIAVAHVLAAAAPGRVAGAFLVAPPAVEAVLERPEIDRTFTPYPTQPLPCPSILVASTNDPFGSYQAAETVAAAWGASLISAGEAGHINAASGHGPWPEGLMSFAGFLGKL